MIYMLMQLMGEEKLRVGLQEYLEEFKFRNAASEDLWAKLEKVGYCSPVQSSGVL